MSVSYTSLLSNHQPDDGLSRLELDCLNLRKMQSYDEIITQQQSLTGRESGNKKFIDSRHPALRPVFRPSGK